MTQLDDFENFENRIAALRNRHGDSVALDDVAEVVKELMTTMEGDLSAIDVRLQRELERLVEYIQKAKEEIAQISPSEINEHHIPVATDELDAVVKATENATDVILDAAEELEQLSGELSSAHAERLGEITNKIYEASNFQDITGQRITKVVSALRHIENKILMLAAAFGDAVDPESLASAKHEEEDEEAGLLNGPQLPGASNTQEDIDALLASFD